MAMSFQTIFKRIRTFLRKFVFVLVATGSASTIIILTSANYIRLNQSNQGLVVAQPNRLETIRTYEPSHFSHLLVADGGYIVLDNHKNTAGISRLDSFGNVLWQHAEAPIERHDRAIVEVLQNPIDPSIYYLLSIPKEISKQNIHKFDENLWLLATITIIKENLKSSPSTAVNLVGTFFVNPIAMMQNLPQSWKKTGDTSFLKGASDLLHNGSFSYSYFTYLANIGNMVFKNNTIYLFGNTGVNEGLSLGVYSLNLTNFVIKAWPYAKLIAGWSANPKENYLNFPIHQDPNFQYIFRGSIAGVIVDRRRSNLVNVAGYFATGENNTIKNDGLVTPTISNPVTSAHSGLIGQFQIDLAVLDSLHSNDGDDDIEMYQNVSNSQTLNFGSKSYLQTNQMTRNLFSKTVNRFSSENVSNYLRVSRVKNAMQFLNQLVIFEQDGYLLYDDINLTDQPYQWANFKGLFTWSQNKLISVWSNSNFENSFQFLFYDFNRPEPLTDLTLFSSLPELNVVLKAKATNHLFLQNAAKNTNHEGLSRVFVNIRNVQNPILEDRSFMNPLKVRDQYLGHASVRDITNAPILQNIVRDLIEERNGAFFVKKQYIRDFINYLPPDRRLNPLPEIDLPVVTYDSANQFITFNTSVINPLTNLPTAIPGLSTTSTIAGFNTIPVYIWITVVISVIIACLLIVIIGFSSWYIQYTKRLKKRSNVLVKLKNKKYVNQPLSKKELALIETDQMYQKYVNSMKQKKAEIIKRSKQPYYIEDHEDYQKWVDDIEDLFLYDDFDDETSKKNYRLPQPVEILEIDHRKHPDRQVVKVHKNNRKG